MTIALFYGRHLGREIPIVLYPTGRAEVITEQTRIFPSAEVTHPSLLNDWERNLVHNCWRDNA
jgi:hypothetical protein